MVPLFRALVKFCSTSRLFTYFIFIRFNNSLSISYLVIISFTVEPLAEQFSEENKRNTGYCSGSEDLEKERLLYMKNDHEDFYLIPNRVSQWPFE